jgi:uncharacterized membrane protein YqjE
MELRPPTERPADSALAQEASVGNSGLLEDAKNLWSELRGLTHDQFQLATLELKLAGESLVMMIAAAVMAAVLVVSAWLGLVTAAVVGLIDVGVRPITALMSGVAFNVVAAVLLVLLIRRRSRYLQFPATRRSLSPIGQGLGRATEK